MYWRTSSYAVHIFDILAKTIFLCLHLSNFFVVKNDFFVTMDPLNFQSELVLCKTYQTEAKEPFNDWKYAGVRTPCIFSTAKQCSYNSPTQTIRYNQVKSGTIRYNQVQSGTIRYNQVQSGTIRYQWVPVGTSVPGTSVPGTSVPGVPRRPRPNQRCYLHLWCRFILVK